MTLLVCALAIVVAEPRELRVGVTLRLDATTVAPADGAVVWLPGTAVEPLARARVTQYERRFVPRVLPIPVGATVVFGNDDSVQHNVFSISEVKTFDLGLYEKGERRLVTFNRPGVVRVYCNIHPRMATYVVVVDGGVFAQTDQNGAAALKRAGAAHEVRVWHELGGEWRGRIEPGTDELRIELSAEQWRDEPHLDKHGLPYQSRDNVY